MSTLFVVRGMTGEYSDRTEWPVCAFTEQWKAERFVEIITAEIRKAETYCGDPHHMPYGTMEAIVKQLKKFDPNIRYSYGRLSYWVETVESLDGIPVIHIDMAQLVQDVMDAGNE